MTHNNRKGIQSVNRVSAINARAKKPARPLSVRLAGELKKNWALYLMILPVIAYYIIFAYIPMSGVVLAFKDFKVKLGIFGSPWAGLKHFERFFGGYNFWLLLRNTVGISLYTLLVGFPIPILFALLLNYLKQERLRKTLQMVSYAPYFISTVVICGMIAIFMDANTGIFNQIIAGLGGTPVDFLSNPRYFKSIYVWSGVWQGMGYSSIIYISALAGVDPSLHEAAIMDGATKIQRIRHIDLPGIKSTIVMLLIMQMGSLMNVGFEKVFLLQNDLNMQASDVINTYVYRVGLIQNNYSYSTAVGLFNSVINMALVIAANQLSKRLTEESLW
jgi:putative aldouronate transport system permease protein